MSAQAAARTALVTAIQAAMPTVQVSPFPRGEDQALKESVHIARGDTAFEWRSLGGPQMWRRNRSETMTLEIVVDVYREGGDQAVSGDQALARADELCELVEHAVGDDLTLNGTVTHALVTGWSTDPTPRDSGWAVRCVARVEAQALPTS